MRNYTLQELVDKTIMRLSMVSGASVQLYSEERVADSIQGIFERVFDLAWWLQFSSWYTWTLDGTLGVVTTDLSNILKRYEDIQVVYYGTDTAPLTQLPMTLNPSSIPTSTVPAFIAPYASASKVFCVIPGSATGTITVYCRTLPDVFALEDTVNFDSELLISGACYSYAEDDGANLGQIEKFKRQFDNRLQQLRVMQHAIPIPYTEAKRAGISTAGEFEVIEL